jgi:hypothetical protein
MQTLDGRSLETYEEVVRHATAAYAAPTNGEVSFDWAAGADLELVSNDRYSARMSAAVKHRGQQAGNLVVLALNRHDGTGDESEELQMYGRPDGEHIESELMFGTYPHETRVLPRAKEAAGVHTEAYLTIASFFPEYPNAEPLVHAGSLDLVGVGSGPHGKHLVRLATLGQRSDTFNNIVQGSQFPEPTVTFTTGYDTATDERFGDPHAVFNDTPMLQFAGFIALGHPMIGTHFSLFRSLNAHVPSLRTAS